ncbi:MAG: Holliday junction resolvase RuvX [Crocinitomicaceae bacterium]|nr:Holliday junction resolvase RuvX [Crocinitomicaceae bacterium]
MLKAIGIDFGLKRTGFAITDDSGIIASPLETIDSRDLPSYLKKIIETKKIKLIVIGFPLSMDGSDTDITENVRQFEKFVKGSYPNLEVVLYDERMTSKIAQKALIQISRKEQRKQKGLIDKMSAAIILQDYMNSLS